jgi:hypothetical protein
MSQIKNIVSCIVSLARDQQTRIAVEDIKNLLEILVE